MDTSSRLCVVDVDRANVQENLMARTSSLFASLVNANASYELFLSLFLSQHLVTSLTLPAGHERRKEKRERR